MQTGLCVNPGKNEVVQSDAGNYLCRALKTKLITEEDSLAGIIEEYAKPFIKKGDILFICEKAVACSQGRAFPLSSIKPGFLAGFFSRFVTKSDIGIGLAMPETMQCAIDECGLIRILFASAVSIAGKLLGQKGWFYHVAGYRAACIDGPCEFTIPPYNNCVVLAPLDPGRTAVNISKMLDGVTVIIVDVNDYGARIIGNSEKIDKNHIKSLLRQNPLGQDDESTPMGIIRKGE